MSTKTKTNKPAPAIEFRLLALLDKPKDGLELREELEKAIPDNFYMQKFYMAMMRMSKKGWVKQSRVKGADADGRARMYAITKRGEKVRTLTRAHYKALAKYGSAR